MTDGAELRAALVSHITNVTTHYGADAYAWDVVNEALTDSYPTGTFKSNTWYPAVPDYVDVAFRAAYEATKSVSLLLVVCGPVCRLPTPTTCTRIPTHPARRQEAQTILQ